MSLPKGWTKTFLNDVVKITTGKYDANHAKENGKYSFFTCAMEPLRCDTFILDEEVLLLPGNGANVGKVFYFKGKLDAYQRTYILSNIKISAKFLYYKMLSDWDEKNKEKQYGSATNYIKLGNFLDYTLEIPPLNEQKRIAKKLDELLTTVESIKTRLDNAPTIIKRFRQSILAAATSGKLTEEWREENGVSGKWELSSFSKLGTLSRGKSKHRPRNDPQLFDGDYPFIQTGAVAQSGGLITEHSKTLSEFGLKQSRLFPKDTLCITIAANIADTAFLTYPTCFPDSVVGFIADEKVCQREFIKYFIDVNKDNLETFAPATAQKNINLTILNALEIPIPTLIEQKEIVSQVESLFTLADTLEEKIEAAKKRVDKLTQSILAKAFRGELVPQDSNDENAEKLLERIKVEQEVVKPKKRSRKRG